MAIVESPLHNGLGPTPEDVNAQVKKMLDSPVFQNSEWSRQLFSFLAEWSLEHPRQHVKEFELAVRVFNRKTGSFDSQTDSVVRVQMARLRTKILEYYSLWGRDDSVNIDIPKGAYCVLSSFRETPREEPVELLVPASNVKPRLLDEGGLVRKWRESRSTLMVVGLLAGVAIGVSGTLVSLRSSYYAPAPPNVTAFWRQVLRPDAPNLLVFSNPRLAGTLAFEGLHYFREDVDSKSPSAENLSYAGAGDAPAVYILTHLFDSLRESMKVRSGAHLSWDQARESNLIFIDRPEQNPALHQLPRLREFYFKFSKGIINAHPRPGEQQVYGCSARPYTEDHALIAFVPGLNPALNTVVLAGTTTYGSLAATEFLANESDVTALLQELGVARGGKIPYFEAVLEVRIHNGIPVWSHLVAKRLYPLDASRWDAPLSDEE